MKHILDKYTGTAYRMWSQVLKISQISKYLNCQKNYTGGLKRSSAFIIYNSGFPSNNTTKLPYTNNLENKVYFSINFGFTAS